MDAGAAVASGSWRYPTWWWLVSQACARATVARLSHEGREVMNRMQVRNRLQGGECGGTRPNLCHVCLARL